MPDFGLTEALAAALKATGRGADEAGSVMRPGERALAAQAAKTGPAAPAVPIASAPLEAVKPPGSIQAPQINPSVPAGDVPAAQSPQVAAAADNSVPAPEPVAQQTADGMPPSGAPAAPETPVAPQTPAPTLDTADPRKAAMPPTEAPAPVDDVKAAATRFVQANLTEVKGSIDMTHMPNVDVMQSPDGMKAAILQVANDNREAIEASRGTAATHDQLIGLAQDLSMDPKLLQQRFDQEFGPVADVASGDQRRATILSARIIEQNITGNLLALSDKVINGTATPDEIIQWTQHEQALTGWITRLAGGGAESGRDLNTFGIHVDGTLDPAVRKHIADIIANQDLTMQQRAAAIRMAGSPSGIAQITQGSAWLRGSKYAYNLLSRVFINGILSGTTAFKVLWNNTINLGINAGDIGVGATYGHLAAYLGRYPTAEEGAAYEDAIANLHGMISGVADGFRVAGRVLKTGISLDKVTRAAETGAGGLEANAGKPTTFAQFFPGQADTFFGRIAKRLDTVVDFPGRVVAAVDDLDKTIGYRGYLTMMTMKEIRAQMAAGTLLPGDAEQAVREMMQHPTPEMEQAAEDWAHRQTFQTPWTPGGAGEAFQTFLNKAPPLRFIFPFMRTATNIFKQSFVERTPLAVLSARLRQQIAAGGMEADIAKGRIATGTAFTSMMAWMAINDRITGGAPKDAKERMMWEADGRQPYSIRVTNPITGKDEWMSYQWFEPIASLAGATADAVKVLSYIHGDSEYDSLQPHDAWANLAIAHIVGAVIENVGNKTFMQGAAAFSEMYNDPKRAFGMWADQMGANMMPYSGLTKEIRNFQDPYLRQAYTLMDKITDDLPTIYGKLGSKTLNARLDFFGQPRVRQGNNSLLGPLTPIPASDAKNDAVIKELGDLMDKTQSVSITMPTKQLALGGSGTGIEGGQGMRLNPDEYNDYVHLSRSEPVFKNGTQTLHDRLAETFKSPTYQSLSPAERHDVVKQIISSADKIGAQRLWQMNDGFRERMQAWTAEKNRIKYGQ